MGRHEADPPDRWWAVHLVSDLSAPALMLFRRGMLLRRGGSLWLTLLDDCRIHVDTMRVHGEKVIQEGTQVRFPCHIVLVERPLGAEAETRWDA